MTLIEKSTIGRKKGEFLAAVATSLLEDSCYTIKLLKELKRLKKKSYNRVSLVRL